MGAMRFVPWAIGGLALMMASAPVSAQKIERKEARPVASMQGVDTFKAYCAVCHGTEAKGNGPAAKALSKTPADLTTITKRHGGTFSQNDVENLILGTNEPLAHGTRDMPIWGPIFEAVNSTDPSLAKLRLSNLVSYLKSIQTQ